MSGSVNGRAERGFHLNVAQALAIHVRLAIIHFVESGDDFGERFTALVEAGRIGHPFVKCGDEIREQDNEAALGGNFGGFGDDEIGAMAQEHAQLVEQRRIAGRRFQSGEPVQRLFDGIVLGHAVIL